MAVTAFVLITSTAKETKRVWEKLKEAPFVQFAHPVSGPYDIIALVQADDVDTLGQLITRDVQSIPGVERTLTSVVMKI